MSGHKANFSTISFVRVYVHYVVVWTDFGGFLASYEITLRAFTRDAFYLPRVAVIFTRHLLERTFVPIFVMTFRCFGVIGGTWAHARTARFQCWTYADNKDIVIFLSDNEAFAWKLHLGENFYSDISFREYFAGKQFVVRYVLCLPCLRTQLAKRAHNYDGR